MSPHHPERAVNLDEFSVQDHLRRQPSHLVEIGRNCGEPAKDNLVHVELVVGDDEDVAANLQTAFLNLAGEGHQPCVQLGAEEEKRVSGMNIGGGRFYEFHGYRVLLAKALYTAMHPMAV